MILPPDLLWSTVDAVGDDIPTLRSLSLTGKVLFDYSQRRLFKSVNFTVNVTNETSCDRISMLTLALIGRPELSTAIRSLTIQLELLDDRLGFIRNPILGRFEGYLNTHVTSLLSLLTHLEELSLGADDTEFRHMHYSELAQSRSSLDWTHHIQSTHLKSLSIYLLPVTIPLSLARKAPQLRHLHYRTAPLKVLENDRDTGAAIVLHTFEYTTSRYRYRQESGGSSLSSAFNAISFQHLERFIFGSNAEPNHIAAARILSVSRDTLRHLTYQVPSHSFDGRHTRLQRTLFNKDNYSLFQTLTALESVEIELHMSDLAHDIRTRDKRLSIWIADAASTTLSAAPSLRALTIRFLGAMPGRQATLEKRGNDWKTLDSHLASGAIPCLKEFGVVLELAEGALQELDEQQHKLLKDMEGTLFRRTLAHPDINLNVRYNIFC
ncbi:hypothetical protein BKA70DRAFT_1312052 [Coprinopsis sp. MPI-PUGE-AT-0042]|nr:hypothetical protein BKA70DRAFT_1312052 [Coprinopsis sp. MPI-PUGE-AT-0042]